MTKAGHDRESARGYRLPVDRGRGHCGYLVGGSLAMVQGQLDHTPVTFQFVYTPDAEDLGAGPFEAFDRRGIEVAATRSSSSRTLCRVERRNGAWNSVRRATCRCRHRRYGGALNQHAGRTMAPPPLAGAFAQVVAIWQPLAKRPGWPERPVSWRDLLKLAPPARPPLRPDQPDFSTSGLNAMIAEYAAATGDTPKA